MRRACSRWRCPARLIRKKPALGLDPTTFTQPDSRVVAPRTKSSSHQSHWDQLWYHWMAQGGWLRSNRLGPICGGSSAILPAAAENRDPWESESFPEKRARACEWHQVWPDVLEGLVQNLLLYELLYCAFELWDRCTNQILASPPDSRFDSLLLYQAKSLAARRRREDILHQLAEFFE